MRMTLDRHGRPLPVPALAERFPLLDDVGMDANRRIVDEDAIVHGADIDALDVPGGDAADHTVATGSHDDGGM